MFTGLLPAGGLSESAVIRYLYIFNKKKHHKKSRTHRVMRDNWRKECCRDLVVPCADMNTGSILYRILFSTRDCITVCHIWLPVVRKNKWLRFQTVCRHKFAQNNQPESQYRQCTRPASAFALPSKSLLAQYVDVLSDVRTSRKQHVGWIELIQMVIYRLISLALTTRRSSSSIRGEHPSRRGNKALKRSLFLTAFAALIAPISRAYYTNDIARCLSP